MDICRVNDFERIKENIDILSSLNYEVKSVAFILGNGIKRCGEIDIDFNENNVEVRLFEWTESDDIITKYTFNKKDYMFGVRRILKSKDLVAYTMNTFSWVEDFTPIRDLDEYNDLWGSNVNSKYGRECYKLARGRETYVRVSEMDDSARMTCRSNPLRLKQNRTLFDNIFKRNRIVTFDEFISWN